MAELVESVGEFTLVPRERDPYEALVESIIYQQLSGKAAGTILRRFKALFPDEPFPSAGSVLDAPVELLRSAGLSGQKTAYVRAVAEAKAAGIVPALREVAALDSDEIVERLTSIKGVGVWTVEMLLIFTLGRPDVLPVTDYGVRKGYAKVFGAEKPGKGSLPTPSELREIGLRWRPYRTAAAWYLWRSLDEPNGSD